MESEGPVEVWQGECLDTTLNFGVYLSLVQSATKVSLSVCLRVASVVSVCTNAYAGMRSCGSETGAGRLLICPL